MCVCARAFDFISSFICLISFFFLGKGEGEGMDDTVFNARIRSVGNANKTVA